jgi:hypothetical protein
MSDLKCLDKIIGLSQNECECFVTEPETIIDESKSGLFLDELEGLELSLLSGNNDCGTGNIWERMQKAIDIATITFRTDLLATLGQSNKPLRKSFNGFLGEIGYKSYITPTRTNYGVKFSNLDIKGGEFTLKSISTLMDTTTSFNVEVWNNISTVPLLVLPNINSVAGVWTNNVLTPDPLLTFPLYDKGCEKLEYFFVYEPIGFKPANNNTTCGCSRRPDWEKWINFFGISGNDMLEADDFQSNNFANGLRLEIQLNCNNAEVICDGENQDFDFDNNPIGRVIAYAIRFKSGEILIEDIIASGTINRFTLLDKERLWGKRNHYRAEYNQRITYLDSEIDINSNDCLICKDKSIGKGAILS